MIEKEHDLRAVDRRAPSPNHSNPAVYVAAVIILCVIGISAIVALQLVQPDKEHTSTITLILGFLVPVVTALLAGAVAQVQKSMNGRLTQLLAMTARTHAAEGELQAREKLTAQLQSQQLQVLPVVVPPPVPATSTPTPSSDGSYTHQRSTDPQAPPTPARANILRSDPGDES